MENKIKKMLTRFKKKIIIINLDYCNGSCSKQTNATWKKVRKKSIHFTNHFWPNTTHPLLNTKHKTQNMSNLCTLSSSTFIFNNIQPFKFYNVNIFTLCIIIFLLLSFKFNYLFNFSQQRIIIAAEI